MSAETREGGRGRVTPEERESYGRGGGARFQEEVYPRSYGSPHGLDWRRALRAYVRGHDRGWESDRKYRAAEDRRGPAERAARTARPKRARRPETPSRPAEGTTAKTEAGPRFGVPVPERLSFHRGASRWRERIPRREERTRWTRSAGEIARSAGEQA